MLKEVSFKGKMLHLGTKELTVGKKMPECVVVKSNMEDAKLSSFFGKITLIIVIPSVDTPVCSEEVRRFNRELALVSKQVKPLVMSVDLPPAQKRYCGAENIEKLEMLSDFRHKEFGEKTGLLIQELGLLTRAVLLVDDQGILRYLQIVEELSKEPDYDAVLHAIDQMI